MDAGFTTARAVSDDIDSVDPVFASTARIWVFLRALYLRKFPWPVLEAAETLEVHPRTIRRYVRFLSVMHCDAEGQPIVTLGRLGRTPAVVVRRPLLPFEAETRAARPS